MSVLFIKVLHRKIFKRAGVSYAKSFPKFILKRTRDGVGDGHEGRVQSRNDTPHSVVARNACKREGGEHVGKLQRTAHAHGH
jgi:hypothetical protein